MSTIEQLRSACAGALDGILDLLPAEVPAEITIIVSHPGTVEDAIVIGTHSLSQVIAIAVRCEQGVTEVGTVQGQLYSVDVAATRRVLQ